MKCDELEEEYLWTNNVKTPSMIMVRAYNADDVDEAIAELKAKLEGAKNETNYWCNNLKVFAQKKDAEIAELKNEIEVQKRLRDMALASVPNVLKVMKIIQHHKYKRCLAMTEMCNARYDEEDAKVNGFGTSWEYISKEMKYWERWSNRWLKIAEQFKEAK